MTRVKKVRVLRSRKYEHRFVVARSRAVWRMQEKDALDANMVGLQVARAVTENA